MGIFNATVLYGRGLEPTETADQFTLRVYTGGFAGSGTAEKRAVEELEKAVDKKGYSSYRIIHRRRCLFPFSYYEYTVQFYRFGGSAVVPELQREESFQDRERPAHIEAKTSGKAIASLVMSCFAFICIPIIPGVLAFIFGLLGLRDIGRSRGRIKGNGIAIAGLILAGVGTAVNLVVLAIVGLVAWTAVTAAQQSRSDEKLRIIGEAIHDHIAKNAGTLPPAAITSPDGKPLLSWRVQLLPYLNENSLYSQFHLNEPWDSPHNIRLLDRMPAVYAPSRKDANWQSGTTYYQAFVGEGAVFETKPGWNGLRLWELDELHMTFLVVEAGDPVLWTKPEDLPFAPNQPLPKLGQFGGDAKAVFADGSVRTVKKGTSEALIRYCITAKKKGPKPPGDL